MPWRKRKKEWGKCIEAIEAGLMYAWRLNEWQQNPQKVEPGEARVSVESLLNDILPKVIDYCSLPEYYRSSLQQLINSARGSPWQTVARYTWDAKQIRDKLSQILLYVAEQLK